MGKTLRNSVLLLLLFFLKKGFVLERRGGREERNISVWLPLVCLPLGTWLATQACYRMDPWGGLGVGSLRHCGFFARHQGIGIMALNARVW